MLATAHGYRGAVRGVARVGAVARKHMARYSAQGWIDKCRMSLPLRVVIACALTPHSRSHGHTDPIFRTLQVRQSLPQ